MNELESDTVSGIAMRRDTIVAIASAAGVSALSVVRVSGPGVRALAGAVVDGGPLRERVASRRRIRHPSGDVIDEGVVLRYESPRSFTGEDALELFCHGGTVTPTRVVEALVSAGARPADPGEFTQRAVLNGRLDILQAEAVNDLIRTNSTAGARLALDQLDGGLSRRLEALRTSILELEAMVGYEIDFPEEDDGPITTDRIATALAQTTDALEALIATNPKGELVRHGAVVVIAGVPNVGKSSLFNALLGRRRAIVTDTPGTTRDALEAVLDTVPFPIRLVDTAGIRESLDPVERMGVAVSRDYIGAAAVILACGDDSKSIAQAVEAAAESSHAPIVVVRTKCDLNIEPINDSLPVSAATGQGLDQLLGRIQDVLSEHVGGGEPDTPVVAHARYRTALMHARDELVEFRRSRIQRTVPVTISAIHLRSAARSLEELLGTIDVEEILGAIFRTFCVGK